MHTWTPQTGVNGDGWKYQYEKDSIRGFQQAHQCSSWTNDYAVYSLMPVTGMLALDQYNRAAQFRHAQETGKPHNYKVLLENGITTDISPVERGAHIRFSFPKGKPSFVVLDGYTGMSGVEIIPGENKIVGYVRNGHYIPENFKNYFVIQFDQPIRRYGIWENTDNKNHILETTGEGKGVGAWVDLIRCKGTD